MTIVAAQLAVHVGGDTKDAEGALDRVGKKTEESRGFFKNAIETALGFAAIAGTVEVVAGAFDIVKDQLKDVVSAGMSEEKVLAQTAAVIKSTGDASGLSAEQFTTMADSLARMSGVSNQTIQSAENILATFTLIGKDTFPAATAAILDVSVAMHQDLQSSAVQVGKALDNPIKGMTALMRIGVTFSEEQKKLIKHLQLTGDMAGAQAVILKELQTEFGGSAKAAGETLGGQLSRLNVIMDQTKEKIGLAIIPALTDMLGHIQPLVGWLSDQLPGALDKAGTFFGALVTEATPFVNSVAKELPDILHTLTDVFNNDVIPALQVGQAAFFDIADVAKIVWNVFREDILPIVEIIGRAIFAQLNPVLHDLQRALSDAHPFILQIGSALHELSPVLSFVAALIGVSIVVAVGIAIGVLRGLIDAFKGVMEILSGVMTFLAGFWDFVTGIFTMNGTKIKKGMGEMLSGLQGIFKGGFDTVLGFVRGFFSGLMGWFDSISGGGLSKIGNFIGGIVGWFASLPGKIGTEIDNLKSVIGAAFEALASSAVDWGKHLIGGFVDGIKNAAGGVKDAIGGVVGGIKNLLGFGSPTAEGPGSNADEWAPNLMAMFASGISGGAGGVHQAALGVANAAKAGLSGISGPSLSSGGASLNPSGAFGSGGSSSQPVSITYEVDGRALARILLPHMIAEIRLKTGNRV